MPLVSSFFAVDVVLDPNLNPVLDVSVLLVLAAVALSDDPNLKPPTALVVAPSFFAPSLPGVGSLLPPKAKPVLLVVDESVEVALLDPSPNLNRLEPGAAVESLDFSFSPLVLALLPNVKPEAAVLLFVAAAPPKEKPLVFAAELVSLELVPLDSVPLDPN